MTVRRSSVVLGVIGALLLGSALLVRLVALPVVSRLPGNLNVTFNYAGTANLLNAQALQSGDTAHVFLTGVPATIQRQVSAVSTTAHTAVVSDTTNLTVGGKASAQRHTYALDRTTLRTRPAPAGTAVEPSNGCLTVAFPLHPKADSAYTVYDSSTQRCFPASYVGAAHRGGRGAYEYTATITGTVKDPQVLQTLPPGLPKQAAAALAPQLPETLRAQLAAALPQLPDPIPLTYAAQTTLNVWADRETGLPLDETLHQQVVAGVTIAGQRVTLMPVLDVSAAATPDTVTSTAHLARTASTKLRLIGIVTPAVLGVLGLLLLSVAVLRRRPPAVPAAEHTQPVAAPGDLVGARR
jgi:Porin PorA